MEMREWHIVISGFQQRSATLNGTVHVMDDLIEICRNRPRARVELITWNGDILDLAERIKKLAPEAGPPVVNLYGYSWGGQTAANLARELRRRSIKVKRMVLTDPVYRAARVLFVFWLLQWRAFCGKIAIRIPDNVDEVTWFRQTRNHPRGHDLRADNAGLTKIGKPMYLDAEHCWMDDHPAWRQACRDAAASLYRATEPEQT